VSRQSPDPPDGLRVLVLAPHPYFQDRGTPMAVHELVQGLTGRGYSVELLTYHEGDDRPMPGCRHTRIPRIPGVRGVPPGPSWKKLMCDLVMVTRAPGLVRRRRIDVVHAVEEASFMALLLKGLFRVPYVYDMDSSLSQQVIERFAWLRPFRRLLEAAERRAIRGSLGVVAVNRSLETLALEAAPGHLVGRLEDFSLLDDEEGASAAEPIERLQDTIGRDGPLILYVGNLMPYQGIDLLLDGFAHAAARHPTAQLVIIGGSPEDIAAYRTRAEDMGLGERVHLLGPRPVAQLGGLLTQAAVLVSPRTVGVNTPMKIYSYLDSDRPLVATRLPTHTQVLDDDIAYLVPPEPVPLGKGLLRLLADRELGQAMATQARQRVRQNHSREAFLRKLNAFYDQVEDHLNREAPPGRRGKSPRTRSRAGAAAGDP
jgi:glycosyltransferase involved in cell wall biosynthesis